jgi:hypothetical protein
VTAVTPPARVLRLWEANYGSRPPSFAWLLAKDFAELWTRFCNLPACKALPQDEAELESVLSRVNALVEAVMGHGPVGILAVDYHPRDFASKAMKRIGGEPITTPAQWLPLLNEYKDDPKLNRYYAAQSDRWTRGLVEDLLAAVISDKGGDLAVIAAGSGDAVLPYDGGVDTFVHDPAKRELLRSRYSDWLWAPTVGDRANSGLTPTEGKLLDAALRAASDGPFFDEWEFESLMGFTRTELRRVAASWRRAPAADQTDTVVTNVLVNLLGFPHGRWDAWADFSRADPDALRLLLERWKETRYGSALQSPE